MESKLFNESGFRFDFSKSLSAVKADEPGYNGLSAVDFIVETDDEYLFIEVKNPDNKNARGDSKVFFENLKPMAMSAKLKDSLLKYLAMGEKFTKPVIYILLLECKGLDAELKLKKFSDINCVLPKFKEENFVSIYGLTFSLYNIREFKESYPMFDVSLL